MPTRLRSYHLAPAIAIVAVLAAGCGGSSSSSSAAEQWAGDVCTSISTWRTDIGQITQQAKDALLKPATAKKELQSAVDQGLESTQTLVTDLQGLDAPDVPEGQQAQQQLDTFVASLQSTAKDVQSALAELPDMTSLADAATSLSGLSTELQTTIQQGQELATTLSALGGELKDAFQNADACKELRSES